MEHGTAATRDNATEVVSPELVLVDPALAARVRPVPPRPSVRAVRAPIPTPPAAARPATGVRVASAARSLRRSRVVPFANAAAAALLATTALTVAGAVTQAADSRPFTSGACAFEDGSCRVAHSVPPVAPSAAADPAPRHVAAAPPKRRAKPAEAPRAEAIETPQQTGSREAPLVRSPLRLAWSPVAGASFYGIRVSRLTAGASAVVLERFPAGPATTVEPGRLPPGRYVWEAWALEGTRTTARILRQAGGGVLTVRSDGSAEPVK